MNRQEVSFYPCTCMFYFNCRKGHCPLLANLISNLAAIAHASLGATITEDKVFLDVCCIHQGEGAWVGSAGKGSVREL